MRILTHDSDLLIVEVRPVVWGLFFAALTWVFSIAAILSAGARQSLWALIAMAAALIAYAIIHIMIERVWVVLDRRASKLEVRRKGMRGYRSDSFALSRLAAAKCQRDRDTARLELSISGRPVPLPVTRYFLPGTGPETAARAINAWLDSLRPAT